jgi:hypothetical protein
MVKRKGIYFATLVVVLAIVAGYAAANIVLTNNTQNASGNYVNGSSGVTGLTYTITILGATSNPAPAASTGTGAVPQAVVTAANAFCGNTCTAGDFSQQITYTFTSSMAGSVFITVQVSSATLGGSATLYLKQAASAVGGTIVIYWDMGTASTTLTAVTTTAQQCSSATCP